MVRQDTRLMTREQWLEARRAGIGGSDSGAILGLNPYRSSYDVYMDKLGLAPEVEDNEAMRQGRDLEEYVAKRFEDAMGKKVRRRNAILHNADYPYALANIDREIVGEKAGLECKTANVLNLKRYKNGEYPSEYYCQCVHYMMVTGYKKWYLAVLVFGTDFKIFEIERDEAEIEALAEAERSFWENNVLKRNPPEPAGTAQTDKTLAALYPAESVVNDIVDVTPYEAEIQRYIALTAREKTIKREKDAIKQSIQAYMQTAARAECKTAVISWRPSVKTSYDAKAIIADLAPEGADLAKYAKATTYRRFEVKEKDNG